MSLNLSTLTLHTTSSPIHIDTRPYIPGSDESLCSFDARMREAMKRVKNSASPCLEGQVGVVNQWMCHNDVRVRE